MIPTPFFVRQDDRVVGQLGHMDVCLCNIDQIIKNVNLEGFLVSQKQTRLFVKSRSPKWISIVSRVLLTSKLDACTHPFSCTWPLYDREHLNIVSSVARETKP